MFILEYSTYLLAVAILALIVLYRWKFHHSVVQTPHQGEPSKTRQNPMPSVVNGWFYICHSPEVKPGDVRQVVLQGEHIALFRGNDRVLYAIDAYCGHLGANLAVGGKVINQTCLRCPFHGWIYDGKNGACVNHDGSPKHVSSYTHTAAQDQILIKEECSNHTTSNRTFLVHESCNNVYLWIHANNEKPTYFPLDFSQDRRGLQYRGKTVNHIYARPQDLPENGADLMHFNLVHNELFPGWNWIIAPLWNATWHHAFEINPKGIEHARESVAEHKRRILNRYIKGQDLSKLGVINLDLNFKVLNTIKFFFFSITGFQVGPGLVYLFFKMPFMEMMYFQYTIRTSSDKITLVHQLYAPWWLPDILTHLILYLEYEQVSNDAVIWSSKRQGRGFMLNMQNQYDQLLLKWKLWYKQFFSGSQKKVNQRNLLEW